MPTDCSSRGRQRITTLTLILRPAACNNSGRAPDRRCRACGRRLRPEQEAGLPFPAAPAQTSPRQAFPGRPVYCHVPSPVLTSLALYPLPPIYCPRPSVWSHVTSAPAVHCRSPLTAAGGARASSLAHGHRCLISARGWDGTCCEKALMLRERGAELLGFRFARSNPLRMKAGSTGSIKAELAFPESRLGYVPGSRRSRQRCA